MVDTVACLIARVINFFLIDIVKEVQAWKLQVYESATCTNLQPVTLCLKLVLNYWVEWKDSWSSEENKASHFCIIMT